MNLRSFLLGSVVALGAKALLVVPEIEADAIAPQAHEPFSDLQFHGPISQGQEVNLACSECPFREVGRRGKVSWTDGYRTSLALNFSIDNGFLLANGRQIFPPPPPTMITAVQRRYPDDEVSEPIPLGYAVEMMPVPMPHEERMEMVEVRFTVLDLDGHPVPLDTIVLSLLHDREGNLYLAKTQIEETPIDRISWKQCRGKPRCLRKLLFNRMRALFAAAKSRMLGMGGGPKPPCKRPGSHGFNPDRMPPPFPEGEEPPMDGDRRPHHHHHMHHMHHGKWRHTFARMVRFIIVPAILGVSAGLTASALGMLVGQTVVYLWRRHRGSDRKETVEEGSDCEKEGLMVVEEDGAQDLPPAYTDEERVAEELPAEKN